MTHPPGQPGGGGGSDGGSTGPGRIMRPIIFGFLRLVVAAIAHWPSRNP
jgi:anti-repressor protein